MDCKTARLHFLIAGPGFKDLDGEETAALDYHLTQCSECSRIARFEASADLELERAMSAVPVPAGLRDRTLAGLVGRNRGTWPRSLVRHRLVMAAIAAVLLLSVGISLYLLSRPYERIDMQLVLDRAIDQRGAIPEAVEMWFREKYGVHTVAPPSFNYAYLDSFDLNGDRRPQLLFLRGTNQAKVVVLTNRDVDIEALTAGQAVDSGGYRLESRPHPQFPNIVYLILFTGGSLDWVLQDSHPSA